MRKGWEYKKLGDCTQILDSQRKPVTKKDRKSGIYPYYGATGIQDYVDKYIFDGRYVLVGEDGAKWSSFTQSAFIIEGKTWVNNHAHVLRTNDFLVDSFLVYFLNYSDLDSYISGAIIRKLTQASLRNIDIPLPPKSTQLAIVSELDKINELIRLKKEQLKDFDNLAQSLFYEMFGDPVENEMGWEVKKLGEICTDITDGDHMPPPKSESGIPFITISDIDKDTRCLNFENTFYVPEDYYNNLKENRKPQKGDLLYTVTGSYGIPVIVKTDKRFCFQRHIALLRPNKEILSTIFLCYWVLSDGVKFMADKVATGIAQKTVGLNSIRKFSCILPPLPLQRLFAQRIEQIEREKSEVQKSIQDFETLLASRMQYWFE